MDLFWTSNPLFNRFLGGQLLSQVGENASKVALPWLFLTLFPNHSSVALSLLVVTQALPPLLFGWFYGDLIDSTNSRKKLLFVSDFSRGVLFLSIPLVVLCSSHLKSTLPIELYGLLFLIAFFSGLFGPTMYSTTPEFSDKAGSLVRRNASLNMTGHVGMVVGPFLGGFLSRYFSPESVLLLTGATFLVSALFIYLIIPKNERGLPKLVHYSLDTLHLAGKIVSEPRLLPRIVENTLFAPKLGSAPRLFSVLAFLVGLSLGPLLSTLPLYVKNVLHGGAGLLGEVLTVAGIGMLTGSGILGLSKHHFGNEGEDKFKRTEDIEIQSKKESVAISLSLPEIWLTFALFLSGLLVVPVALIHTGWILMIVIFLASGLVDIFNPLMQTEVQSRTPAGLTGRVLTSLGTFFLVGLILGTVLSPKLLDIGGMYGVFVMIGGVRILASLVPLFIATKRIYGSRLPTIH